MPTPPNLHSRLRTDSCLFSSKKFWGRVICVQNLLDASESNMGKGICIYRLMSSRNRVLLKSLLIKYFVWLEEETKEERKFYGS